MPRFSKLLGFGFIYYVYIDHEELPFTGDHHTDEMNDFPKLSKLCHSTIISIHYLNKNCR